MQWGKGLRPGGPYHPLLFVGKTFILFWYELHIKVNEKEKLNEKSPVSHGLSHPRHRDFFKFSLDEGERWP